METANDPIISSDSQGLIITWNSAATRACGNSVEEIMNQPVTLIMPEQFAALRQLALDRAVSVGRLYHTLVEEVTDVIFILNHEGRFTYLNVQAEAFLKQPLKDIPEVPLASYVVLPEERDLHKIFSPFFTTKHYGAGIGLTVSKKIVEAHNGTMSVHSADGGTTFTVWFPLSRQEAVPKLSAL